MSLFLCLPSISLGQNCQNNVVKGGFEKVYKVGMAISEVLSIEGEFKPSAYYGIISPSLFIINI